jgi:hypothetical protein
MERQDETRITAGHSGLSHTNNASSLWEEDRQLAILCRLKAESALLPSRRGISITVRSSPRRLMSHAYRPGIDCCWERSKLSSQVDSILPCEMQVYYTNLGSDPGSYRPTGKRGRM